MRTFPTTFDWIKTKTGLPIQPILKPDKWVSDGLQNELREWFWPPQFYQTDLGVRFNYVKPQANFQPIFSYLGKWR